MSDVTTVNWKAKEKKTFQKISIVNLQVYLYEKNNIQCA